VLAFNRVITHSDRVLALYKPIEALDVVEKYNLFHFVPDSVRRVSTIPLVVTALV